MTTVLLSASVPVILYENLQGRNTDLETALKAANVTYNVFFKSEDTTGSSWANVNDNATWPKLYTNYAYVTAGNDAIKAALIK
jgi:hypothetical protein